MIVMFVRNVCEALPAGVNLLLDKGVLTKSRAGDVLVSPGPVTTVYEHPWERVLTSPVRDANPFFHLIEALWMLSGSDDASCLDHYVRDFSMRFAEPGGTSVHGAYGHRWRHALGFDQLNHVVEVLERDPTSRQCVVQMWDGMARHEVTQDAVGVGIAEGDVLTTGCDDLRAPWRDRPCNTHIYLRVRKEFVTETAPEEVREKGVVTQVERSVLDLTVCCRSNDIIWGAYGANAVHFSVLQEYLASRIGVVVGKMYQVSNNYHVYVRELEKLRKRAGTTEDPKFDDLHLTQSLNDNRYYLNWPEPRRHVPLVQDPETFDSDLESFFQWHNESWEKGTAYQSWASLTNPFLSCVAVPMVRARIAWENIKNGGLYGRTKTAVQLALDNADTAWRVASVEWMERRARVLV